MSTVVKIPLFCLGMNRNRENIKRYCLMIIVVYRKKAVLNLIVTMSFNKIKLNRTLNFNCYYVFQQNFTEPLIEF